jgi:hypothetical protein
VFYTRKLFYIIILRFLFAGKAANLPISSLSLSKGYKFSKTKYRQGFSAMTLSITTFGSNDTQHNN